MFLEVTFWIAFIFASRAIAGIYYRRRDVPYGSYRATARTRRSRADERSSQNFNQWASATEVRRLEHLRAPRARPDIAPSRVRRRARPAKTIFATSTVLMWWLRGASRRKRSKGSVVLRMRLKDALMRVRAHSWEHLELLHDPRILNQAEGI
jgi:hypothetical protein